MKVGMRLVGEGGGEGGGLEAVANPRLSGNVNYRDVGIVDIVEVMVGWEWGLNGG